jgi:hypothetical protein
MDRWKQLAIGRVIDVGKLIIPARMGMYLENPHVLRSGFRDKVPD